LTDLVQYAGEIPSWHEAQWIPEILVKWGFEA